MLSSKEVLKGAPICVSSLQLSPFVSAVRARLQDMQNNDLARGAREAPGCALVIDGKVGSS